MSVFIKEIRNQHGRMDIPFEQLKNVNEIKNAFRNHQIEYSLLPDAHVTIYVGPLYYEIFYSNVPHKCDLIKID